MCKHNGINRLECYECYKKTNKPAKLENADIKMVLWNLKAKERESWLIKYWQALKEIWQQPVNCYADFAVLEKHGLGRYQPNWGTKDGFVWDYELRELDKQLRIKI